MTTKHLERHQQLMKESFINNKMCYVEGCGAKTIKAHSITNNRHLIKISEEGMVSSLNTRTVPSNNIELIEVGRSKASTFRGFCVDHDSIFNPIDEYDYKPCDKNQEYLFALRAHAKEYNARIASDEAMSKIDTTFDVPEENIARLRGTYHHFSKGTADQKLHRKIFNDTHRKGKYNAIDTLCLEVRDKELPIVFSSSFNLERNDRGEFINDVSDLKSKMKPTFMTVFPQNGNTYCLISYFHRDRKSYAFLNKFKTKEQREMEVLISNLIFAYGENFYINPRFWKTLDPTTKNKLSKIFAISMSLDFVPLIADPSFNLFEGIG